MESKLKALKVVDLKDILSKASVTITGKTNKQDLIAKILGSPAALDVYHKNYGPAPASVIQDASPVPSSQQDDSEATPQPPKATVPLSSSKPTKAAPSFKSVPQDVPKKVDAPTGTTEPTDPSSVIAEATPNLTQDEEAEKRKARAARFGIPVVEPKLAPSQKNGKAAAANGQTVKNAAPDDSEKIAARAARFGVQAPSAQPQKNNGRKRPAPAADPVDEEELARRKRRAERFGIPLVGA